MVYIIYQTIKEKNLGIIYLRISIPIYSHFFQRIINKEVSKIRSYALSIIMGAIKI